MKHETDRKIVLETEKMVRLDGDAEIGIFINILRVDQWLLAKLYSTEQQQLLKAIKFC